MTSGAPSRDALSRLLLLAPLLAACGSPRTAEPPRPRVSPDRPPPAAPGATASSSVAPPTTIAQSANRFGCDLWARARTQPGNLAISPSSIWVALAMTHAGARGATAEEMSRVMHLPAGGSVHADAARQLATWNDAARTAYTLRVVNRLFGERSVRFEAPYLALTRDLYRAELEGLDFQRASEPARLHINAWVAEQTSDRIRDLLPPRSIDPDTRLVLVNAIYFLGRWLSPFPRSATTERPFHLGTSESVPVPTMQRQGHYAYAEADDAQLVEMPYVGGELSMVLVVPRRTTGLDAVEARLDAATIDRWVAGLSDRLVRLVLPKFTIDPPQSVALVATLRQMGMSLAVDRARADFTGIANPASPRDRLFIGEVFHKAFVRVDEEGTEAAAATAVVMPRGGGMPRPEQPIEVRADRPFLFLLRDMRTGMVLFIGRVADPRAR